MTIFYIDPYRCIGCEACLDECPTYAICPGEVFFIDPIRCIGCGACFDICPTCACIPVK